jgi:L-ascorbate metabolism protein UlaG (beta-lactamase superfamily)
MFEYRNLKITKYLQSGFKIEWEGDKTFALEEMENGRYKQVIYIDPYKLPEDSSPADIIFITHEHLDHFDIESLRQIVVPTTQFISNASVVEILKNHFDNHFEIVNPGFQKGVNGLIYMALPAYNLNKFNESGDLCHRKDAGGLGFLLNFNISDTDSTFIYHMGDTDFIAELQTPSKVDILMIPISGTYVMTPQEAVEATNLINPEIVIPIHHDAGIAGSPDQVQVLRSGVSARIVELSP